MKDILKGTWLAVMYYGGSLVLAVAMISVFFLAESERGGGWGARAIPKFWGAASREAGGRSRARRSRLCAIRRRRLPRSAG